MTTPADVPAGSGQPPELADQVVSAVLAVPGVVTLHAGMFGEVGTYLPGRRIAGVRMTDSAEDGMSTEVHVTLEFGAPVRPTAVLIRDAVAQIVGGTVDVTIEDVVPTSL